jgi:hypothetical protein
MHYFFEFNPATNRGVAIHRTTLSDVLKVQEEDILVELTEEECNSFAEREDFNPELYVLADNGSIIKQPFPDVPISGA